MRKKKKKKFEDWSPEDLIDNTAFLITDIGRLMRTGFDAKMAELGLARSEWYLLAHLCFFDGATQQELADTLDLTKGGMAKLIDRMEQKGLVQRENDTRDGRATKRIRLTPLARPLALKVDRASVKTVQHSVSRLTPEQTAQMHALLRVVRSTLMDQSG